MLSYFQQIKTTIQTLGKGAKLTLRHFFKATQYQNLPLSPENENYFRQPEGMVTLQYPHEKLPLPDNARYQLHNEIEDCIVCDKCAKICPVNCIDIEPIKATEQIGTTSDGTPIRLYAAKFDIDMAKCCFCGLCTTVCPTECLTMTHEYDVSVFDSQALNLPFSTMTEIEIAEKKEIYQQHQAQKIQKEKEAQQETVLKNAEKETNKTQMEIENTKNEEKASDNPPPKARPVFKPKMK
jgi:formate hydrogenlyase subunit 6/NADH:ubiquinone oxidoreductase subunit I